MRRLCRYDSKQFCCNCRMLYSTIMWKSGAVATFRAYPGPSRTGNSDCRGSPQWVDRRCAGCLLEDDRPLWTMSCPLVGNPEIDGNSAARVGVPLHRVVVPALAARTDLICHVVVTGFNGVGANPEGQLLIPVVRLVAQVSPLDTYTPTRPARCGTRMPSKALIPLRWFISDSRGGSGTASTLEPLTACLY